MLVNIRFSLCRSSERCGNNVFGDMEAPNGVKNNFWNSRAPKVTKMQLLQIRKLQTLEKYSFGSSGSCKRCKHQVFVSPEHRNAMNIKVLEPQKSQTL